MSEKRFTTDYSDFLKNDKTFIKRGNERLTYKEIVDLLNEQQELIEELQVSDEMGWKRAEHFEKKCPKELHNKKMYIKRLEYKVQKFKEENEKLRFLIDINSVSERTKLERQVDKQQIIITALKEENKKLKNFIELMNMRQKWKLYNYKGDNDE